MDEHNKFAYNCIKHGRIGKMEKKGMVQKNVSKHSDRN